MTSELGIKHDQEKPTMELLSSKWLYGVAAVLAYGKRKYSAHQWRKGLHQSRVLGAALRHVLSYMDGEDLDPETSLSHLYHASCCLMFASELALTHPEMDDRYKSLQKHVLNGAQPQDLDLKTNGAPKAEEPLLDLSPLPGKWVLMDITDEAGHTVEKQVYISESDHHHPHQKINSVFVEARHG